MRPATPSRHGAAREAAVRRLSTQFLAACGGVLVVLGIVVADLGGPLALAAYVVVTLALIGLAARRARALTARPAGRTCSCCTGTVYDPVEVR